MKKTIVLLLTALLVFTGCSGEEPVEYVIYGEKAEFLDNSSASTGDAVDFEKAQILAAEKLDVEQTNRQSFSNDSAPKTRKLAMNGTEYEYSLMRSFQSGLASCKNESLNEYGIIDEYEYSSGPVTLCAQYNPKGDLVMFGELGSQFIPGDFTEDDAKKLSLQLIRSLYGKSVAAEYTFESVQVNDSGYISVNYVKYIGDYPTLDTILIRFHGNGNVKSIRAKQRGIFTSLEDSITTKKIDAAKAALMERIGGDWEPGEISLAVGADGKCYLQVYGSWNESAQTAPVYYININ